MQSNDLVQQKIIQQHPFEHKELFVIVDGVLTGKRVAPLLRGNGYDGLIHIQSKRGQSLGTHISSDYMLNLMEGDNIQDLVRTLKQLGKIQAIIPASECGVLLADQLNEALQMPNRNDFSLAKTRQNKFLMQDVINKAGLLAAEQIRTENFEELMQWVAKNGLPVVLKPEESAGSDGVRICYNAQEVKEAFDNIMSHKSIHGIQNINVVAQEMLMGDEFMVNTVSFNNKTFVTDITLVGKKIVNGTPLYDYSTLVRPEDPRFDAIATYVKQVLHYLGFYYGASHTEVILTKKGPTLVEVNPRLTGADNMSATTEATGDNQAAALVNAYLKGDEYVSRRVQDEKRPHQNFLLTSYFIANESGVLVQEPNLDAFRAISENQCVRFSLSKGSMLTVTNTVINSPGMANFVGNDYAALLAAHEKFRKCEQALYTQVLAKSSTSLMIENGSLGFFNHAAQTEKTLSSLPRLGQ